MNYTLRMMAVHAKRDSVGSSDSQKFYVGKDGSQHSQSKKNATEPVGVERVFKKIPNPSRILQSIASPTHQHTTPRVAVDPSECNKNPHFDSKTLNHLFNRTLHPRDDEANRHQTYDLEVTDTAAELEGGIPRLGFVQMDGIEKLLRLNQPVPQDDTYTSPSKSKLKISSTAGKQNVKVTRFNYRQFSAGNSTDKSQTEEKYQNIGIKKRLMPNFLPNQALYSHKRYLSESGQMSRNGDWIKLADKEGESFSQNGQAEDEQSEIEHNTSKLINHSAKAFRLSQSQKKERSRDKEGRDSFQTPTKQANMMNTDHLAFENTGGSVAMQAIRLISVSKSEIIQAARNLKLTNLSLKAHRLQNSQVNFHSEVSKKIDYSEEPETKEKVFPLEDEVVALTIPKYHDLKAAVSTPELKKLEYRLSLGRPDTSTAAQLRPSADKQAGQSRPMTGIPGKQISQFTFRKAQIGKMGNLQSSPLVSPFASTKSLKVSSKHGDSQRHSAKKFDSIDSRVCAPLEQHFTEKMERMGRKLRQTGKESEKIGRFTCGELIGPEAELGGIGEITDAHQTGKLMPHGGSFLTIFQDRLLYNDCRLSAEEKDLFDNKVGNIPKFCNPEKVLCEFEANIEEYRRNALMWVKQKKVPVLTQMIQSKKNETPGKVGDFNVFVKYNPEVKKDFEREQIQSKIGILNQRVSKAPPGSKLKQILSEQKSMLEEQLKVLNTPAVGKDDPSASTDPTKQKSCIRMPIHESKFEYRMDLRRMGRLVLQFVAYLRKHRLTVEEAMSQPIYRTPHFLKDSKEFFLYLRTGNLPNVEKMIKLERLLVFQIDYVCWKIDNRWERVQLTGQVSAGTSLC